MSSIQTWKWERLHAHQEDMQAAAPCPRDIWGGMLAYNGCLFVFGGAYLKYGPAKTHGDLTTLGTLNDLWRYDPKADVWTRLEEDDGRSGFSPLADRPCGRVLPAWVAVKDRFYLFGGLSVLDAGWHTGLLNDLWSYDPVTGRWEMLEPHDAQVLESPAAVASHRPTILAAMGVACVDDDIYLMAGWGRTPQVVLSPQLWRYDVLSRTWEHSGTKPDRSDAWPSKRYCPAFVRWEDRLYLWGGRDTQDIPWVFYNDLWEYDPKAGGWTCIQESRPDDPYRPSPRYGMGQACIGHHWYVFGGFGSEEGDGPQLNDLWRYDFRSATWECLCLHNGAKDYTRQATRPGVRRVPGMVGIEDSVYLFGGVDLASGEDDDGPTVGFNDLWRGRPVAETSATSLSGE